MNLDFPTILVLLTFLTGIVWLLDAVVWAPQRREHAAELERTGGAEPDSEAVNEARKEPVLVEYARSFFPIILIVLVVRSFLVEPFRIPSGSMMPTLLIGDFILVNKFNYGIRLPVVNAKVLDIGDPERGDIVVFRYPENPAIDYIKRVVGLPGDRIAYRDKVLYINGERTEQDVIGTYVAQGAGATMSGASLRLEDLGQAEHGILVMPHAPDSDFEFTVPANEYFVMGDNRDNSKDSRYWGTVPNENLVGEAFLIWMHWDSVGGVGWQRIGTLVE